MAEYTISSDTINEEFEQIKSFLENNSIDGKRLIDLYHEIHSEGNYCFDRAVRYELKDKSKALQHIDLNDILEEEIIFYNAQEKEKYLTSKSMHIWLNHYIYDKLQYLCEQLRDTILKSHTNNHINRSIEFLDSIIHLLSRLSRYIFPSDVNTVLFDTGHIDTGHIFLYEIQLRSMLISEYSIPNIYVNYKIWKETKKTEYLKKVFDGICLYIKIMFSRLQGKFHYNTTAIFYVNALGDDLEHKTLFEDFKFITIKFLQLMMAAIMSFDNAITYKAWGKEFIRGYNLYSDENFQEAFPSSIMPYIIKQYKDFYKNDNVRNIIFAHETYFALSKGKDIFNIFYNIFMDFGQLSEEEKIVYGFNDNTLEKLYDPLCKIKSLYEKFIYEHDEFYERKNELLSILTSHTDKENYKFKQEISAKRIKSAQQDTLDDSLEFLDGIQCNNEKELTQAKQKYIKKIRFYAADIQIDKLEHLCKKIEKKLREIIQKEEKFEIYQKNIETDFVKYMAYIPTSIWQELASAEFLYDKYIKNNKEQEGFDYCCVSILYYKTLESFVNTLLYSPYKHKVLDNVSTDKIQNSDDYLGKDARKHFYRSGKLKNECELGNIGILCKKTPKYFKQFLEERKINVGQIKEFGKKVIYVKDFRNDAAHGGKLITFDTAKKDKIHIYISNEKDNIINPRDLLKCLLSIIYPNK